MNKSITFKTVSYTDAGGKFNKDAYLNGNEDNFFVDDDLSDDTISKAHQDETIKLGTLGMLMCVADGMGGMNAGEIASQITIETVKENFEKKRIKRFINSNYISREDYLKKTIKDADIKIKEISKKDSTKEGMGSTIILGWLFGDELSIAWIGDSRAYIFHENSGIRLVSKDHSYVQELVNNGLLTYNETFNHPQNNIITRSLGDCTQPLKPDCKTLKIGKGDIILLCSDGLTGVLRDRKGYDTNGNLYSENNIEDILRNNCSSLKKCREVLWEAAEREGWYDNITVILCQIIDGPPNNWMSQNRITQKNNSTFYLNLPRIIFCLLWIGSLLGAFFVGRITAYYPSTKISTGNPELESDSLNMTSPGIKSESDSNNSQVTATSNSIKRERGKLNGEDEPDLPTKDKFVNETHENDYETNETTKDLEDDKDLSIIQENDLTPIK